MKDKTIIAFGGAAISGGEANNFAKFVLSQSKSDSTKIMFLPQASNEDPYYVIQFFQAFSALPCQPSWLSLYGSVSNCYRQKILSQDIILVGGGNTVNMLSIWKAWGVDNILHEAYQKGIVLVGVSAGAMCWFEEGLSDSTRPLSKIECLGFLNGSFCPHYNDGSERLQLYNQMVFTDQLKNGIGVEDNAAVVFKNDKVEEIVSLVAEKNAFFVCNNYIEKMQGKEINLL